ncbi:MAG: S8 family serine peptidase [Candidatus Krumholzibacteriia bacterium]
MRHAILVTAIAVGVTTISTHGYAQTPRPKWTPALERAVQAEDPGRPMAAWVFFTDKGRDLARRLAKAEDNLTPRARKRRLRNRGAGNLVDRYDVPVEPRYVRQVAATAVHIRQTSRWLNAVSVDATPEALRRLSGLSCVEKLDVVRHGRVPQPEISEETARPPRASSGPQVVAYGPSFTQNDQINVPMLHDLGFNGNGVMICMLDAGFNNLGHTALDHLDILATRDFVNGDSIVSDQPGQMGSGNHGTWTLSTIGGFEPGQLIGPAWGATYLLAKTENTSWERHVEEDAWIAGAEWGDSIGTDIISSSLGYLDGFTSPDPDYTWSDMDGNTTIVTIGADIAAGRGILVVNSAGNNALAPPGTNSLIGPADGDSVLAVGAITNTGVRAGFSSTGPTADGRIKPDVMAMGQAVHVASAADPVGFLDLNGTSFSCPLVAGAAALMLEVNPSVTNMEIIGALRSTADNAASPDSLVGWGIIDVHAAAFSTVTGIDDRSVPRREVALYPAFPNPFNPTTTLRYELPQSSHVVLTVYNVRGERVTTLVNEPQSRGFKSVVWNGTDRFGNKVSSGLYIYRLQAGDFETSRKMMLLK